MTHWVDVQVQDVIAVEDMGQKKARQGKKSLPAGSISWEMTHDGVIGGPALLMSNLMPRGLQLQNFEGALTTK
jgi:hypothetical protein